jgi:MFS family permease
LRISVLGNLFARLGFSGAPFLLPLLLQIGLGYSSQVSGLLLAPIAIGLIAIRPFSVYLLKKLGFKRILIFNTLALGVSLWLFSLITFKTSIFIIGLMSFVFGVLATLQYSSMNPLAYAETPEDKLSAVTSMMGTTQQLAQSFGVAICALVLTYFSVGQKLTVGVFHHTFWVMGGITMLSSLLFINLRHSDGQETMLKGSDA